MKFFGGGGIKIFLKILKSIFFIFRRNWNWEKIFSWNFFWWGVSFPVFFVHESFSYGQNRLHPKFHLPKSSGSALKVLVWVREGWEGGLTSIADVADGGIVLNQNNDIIIESFSLWSDCKNGNLVAASTKLSRNVTLKVTLNLTMWRG